MLKNKCTDFGPTLAAENLLDLEGITVSRATSCQFQIGPKLWKPERRRIRRVFRARERQPGYGELLHIYGYQHT